MKINHISLLICSTIFASVFWVRQAFFSEFTRHGRYYLIAILAISGILTLISLCRLIRPYHRRLVSRQLTDRQTPKRPRRHYRLNFENSPPPMFIQKTNDRLQTPAWTCPVADISESGIRLVCSGMFTVGQTVQGEVIFDSGRTAPINGVVVREAAGRTSLRLHCTIDPPLLMAEQRDQILTHHGNGPRPAITGTVLKPASGSLPSHRPKGICRLK